MVDEYYKLRFEHSLNWNSISSYFSFLPSVFKRRKCLIRENIWLPVFDGVKHFSGLGFAKGIYMCVCLWLCLSIGMCIKYCGCSISRYNALSLVKNYMRLIPDMNRWLLVFGIKLPTYRVALLNFSALVTSHARSHVIPLNFKFSLWYALICGIV